MEIHLFLRENVFAFFFFLQQIGGPMFTVLTEWTPGSSSKHVVWYNKAQEESDNISSLSSLPTALIISILEKTIFSPQRPVDPLADISY